MWEFFQTRTRVAPTSGPVRTRAWSLEQTSVFTELELSPSALQPYGSLPHLAKLLLAVSVGGPRQQLSSGGAGQEMAVNLRVSPYLWEKTGKIQGRQKAVVEARGLVEVTPPWPHNNQLWKQPSVARLRPSLQPGPRSSESPSIGGGHGEQ